ncbi:glycogen debranching protein GlgX [Luteibacter yeojuensis]|uniref:Glycogen debranching protein GlgX n=1 Tax=Luteibacter yeojuensis TaxID=345309 RepID=A0A7X5QSI2_9GAMM|nr:glycogen debranching protein GlgX [Luteibacter yeojuensis]
MAPFVLTAGTPKPLGAHWDGRGVNLSVFTRHARRVEWCLFDSTGQHELARLPLSARDGDVWHGYLEGAAPGLVYGLRVHGPYDPANGHRFNPNKLLIDPYARALHGSFQWTDAVYGYVRGPSAGTGIADARDSAPFVPKCVLTAPLPAARARPARPRTPWTETVIYEMHVKGQTMRHPGIPADIRGTIAALADPNLIAYWRELGMTALEWMPIASFLDEEDVARHGLTDYWGYNPIAPLAVHTPYLASGHVEEIVDTIDRLHAAGLEVILDIVLNHTAEGGANGPTLSLRGLDNATYYQLRKDDAEAYVDDSGCGNTVDPGEPAVIALFHAALRYWACEIGVDGFRFDLAPLLGRWETGRFDANAALWRTIAADPELRDIKLIAEPWDASTRGSALGAFPTPIREWNGRYRDDIRRFWRGDARTRGALATRFAGSSDIFGHAGRTPGMGVNFVTCHDGFTLADLTAYAVKHNEANPYGGEDGSRDNLSANGGVEGPTRDAGVLAARRRRCRAMLGTLALSRGVPMFLAGDELSRTQLGNNNAFCQDNAMSWLDWSALGDPARDLRAWIADALSLRRRLRCLRLDAFYMGTSPSDVADDRDLRWFEPDGREMDDAAWEDGVQRGLAILVSGPSMPGKPRDRLFLALNPGHATLPFSLPAPRGIRAWRIVLDSDDDTGATRGRVVPCGSPVDVVPGGWLAFECES